MVSPAWALALALAWATPAHANWVVDWVRTVGTGGNYFDVKTTDPASTPIEDVESRQQLDNTLSVDSAFAHLGLQYEVMMVDLQQNEDLSYLDHQVGANFNVDRWLRRYTEDGRLTLKATARVSPSLPPLDPERLPTGASGRDPEALNDLSPSEYFVHHDVLNIQDDPTGYTMYYGMAYSDELGPFRRYDVGWDIEDNRYDSALVQNSRVLHLHGTYALRLVRGETGVSTTHDRQLGQARFNNIYGVSVFRTSEARRWTWRVEPGVIFQPNERRFRGSFLLSWTYTMPRATLETAYSTTRNVAVLGPTALERVHRLFVTLHTNRNYRSPRWITLDTRWEDTSRRFEVSAGQRFQILRSLAAVFQYGRSGIWWDDGLSPDMVSWRSQIIGGDLRWQF